MKKAILVACVALAAMTATAQTPNGLQRVNGTLLFFKTIGKGEPVLVIHGGPGMNHTYLLPHLEALAKKNKLIFYDQRASGNSALPSVDSISLKFFADDIEGIRLLLGENKLNILAHSWGSVVAVSYAKYYPDRVNKMVLVNPSPLSHEYDREIAQKQAETVLARDSSDRSIIIGSRDFRNKVAGAYANLLRVSFRHSFYEPRNLDKLVLELPPNYVAANTALYSGLNKDVTTMNYYEDVKKFSFPLLVIHGRYDMVPLVADTRLQSSVPGAKLLIFTKSGHFAFIEEKGRFVKEVAAFYE